MCVRVDSVPTETPITVPVRPAGCTEEQPFNEVSEVCGQPLTFCVDGHSWVVAVHLAAAGGSDPLRQSLARRWRSDCTVPQASAHLRFGVRAIQQIGRAGTPRRAGVWRQPVRRVCYGGLVASGSGGEGSGGPGCLVGEESTPAFGGLVADVAGSVGGRGGELAVGGEGASVLAPFRAGRRTAPGFVETRFLAGGW
jgi:hypothetical protein